MTNFLKVKYHNRIVGILGFDKNNRIFFRYDDEWLHNGFSISPFSLPLLNKDFYPSKPYFKGLHGVFGDSFVDSWGELLIQRYLKEKGIDYDSVSILDKLSIIGNSTMGALTYHPNEGINFLNSECDLDKTSREIEKILNNEEIKGIDELFKRGGSSGGSRPKIYGKYNNRNVIIKFKARIDSKNIAEQEYEYMLKAKECGINVPDVFLIEGKINKYYAVERFDIKDNKRVHIISASGLLECDYNAPCLDYRDLLKLTSIVTSDKNDVLQMYRRMVFNVIFKNLDDHAKNFSFFYDDVNQKYNLCPAFDLTKGTTFFGEHTTSINGKGKDISDEDMIKLALEFGIKEDIAKDIIKLTKEKYSETKNK